MKQARRSQRSGSGGITRGPQRRPHAARGRSSGRGLDARSQPGPDLVEHILQSDRFILLAKLSPSMAHEIINPIAAVINLATLMQHILKDDGIPAGRISEFRGYLSQVIGESGRAGRIASEMLAFSRASSRAPESTDANEIARHALSLASHMLKTEDVESHLDLGEGLPMVRCDRSSIEHALLHMLVNAAESVQGRELRSVTIKTRLREDKRAVVLQIRDTGEGIPGERISLIFEPFFTTKEKPGSLGLGLTIVRNLLQAQRAAVKVDSTLNEGTTFTVELPISSIGEER